MLITICLSIDFGTSFLDSEEWKDEILWYTPGSRAAESKDRGFNGEMDASCIMLLK